MFQKKISSFNSEDTKLVLPIQEPQVFETLFKMPACSGVFCLLWLRDVLQVRRRAFYPAACYDGACDRDMDNSEATSLGEAVQSSGASIAVLFRVYKTINTLVSINH